MKTQNNNTLDFKKKVIVELNNDDLNQVKGGSTEICSKDSRNWLFNGLFNFLITNYENTK
ncbi:class I lanthipeptide [Lacinutrix neustonica]|uniref:Class I lanthipeptide n=1 Tax=Lacinutrix neustonica TaxID=2980107 RepID=A0A9E8MT69_9FLAO|nr:class I lanthipeptide [Lacinutrix neustonica]WAC01027.1 class I lanthipeptide [Lacinutrix neustonica]